MRARPDCSSEPHPRMPSCTRHLTGVGRLPIKSGMTNSEEFDRLYEANYDRLCAALRRKNVADCILRGEDVAQQMYVHLRSQFHRFDGENFVGWACTSARNWATSETRRKANQSGRLPGDGDGLADQGTTPLDALIDREQYERLAECKKRLLPHEQAIVEGKIADRSSEEISRDLPPTDPPTTWTPAKINTAYFKIKEKLRNCVNSKDAKDGGETRR